MAASACVERAENFHSEWRCGCRSEQKAVKFAKRLIHIEKSWLGRTDRTSEWRNQNPPPATPPQPLNRMDSRLR